MPVRVDIRKIATVSAILTLLVFALILIALGDSLSSVGKALLKGGLALTATGLFWSFYAKLGWRLHGLRLFGWLSPYPDLNGRWEGTVLRRDESEPHAFVMEIVQTFTTLSYRTFSQNSHGQSLGAFMTCNEEKNVYGVVGYWQTTTKRRDGSDLDETFTGISELTLEMVKSPKGKLDTIRIVDRYFTGRTPATSGRLELRRVSRTLQNGFASMSHGS